MMQDTTYNIVTTVFMQNWVDTENLKSAKYTSYFFTALAFSIWKNTFSITNAAFN